MTAWADMAAAFVGVGLPEPPVPVPLRDALDEQGRWCWATKRMRGMEMYFYWPLPFQALLNRRIAAYVAVSYAGHGVNSYAVTYHLVYRSLAVYIQMPWGGIYTDNDRNAAQLAEMFDQTQQLIELAEQRPHDPSSRWRLICNANELRGWWICAWTEVPQRGQDAYDLARVNALGRGSKPLAIAAEFLRAGPPPSAINR